MKFFFARKLIPPTIGSTWVGVVPLLVSEKIRTPPPHAVGTGRVVRVGLGWVRSGQVGSGWVGSGRVGLGWVGSGPGQVRLGRVGSGSG